MLIICSSRTSSAILFLTTVLQIITQSQTQSIETLAAGCNENQPHLCLSGSYFNGAKWKSRLGENLTTTRTENSNRRILSVHQNVTNVERTLRVRMPKSIRFKWRQICCQMLKVHGIAHHANKFKKVKEICSRFKCVQDKPKPVHASKPLETNEWLQWGEWGETHLTPIEEPNHYHTKNPGHHSAHDNVELVQPENSEVQKMMDHDFGVAIIIGLSIVYMFTMIGIFVNLISGAQDHKNERQPKKHEKVAKPHHAHPIIPSSPHELIQHIHIHFKDKHPKHKKKEEEEDSHSHESQYSSEEKDDENCEGYADSEAESRAYRLPEYKIQRRKKLKKPPPSDASKVTASENTQTQSDPGVAASKCRKKTIKTASSSPQSPPPPPPSPQPLALPVPVVPSANGTKFRTDLEGKELAKEILGLTAEGMHTAAYSLLLVNVLSEIVLDRLEHGGGDSIPPGGEKKNHTHVNLKPKPVYFKVPSNSQSSAKIKAEIPAPDLVVPTEQSSQSLPSKQNRPTLIVNIPATPVSLIDPSTIPQTDSNTEEPETTTEKPDVLPTQKVKKQYPPGKFDAVAMHLPTRSGTSTANQYKDPKLELGWV